VSTREPLAEPDAMNEAPKHMPPKPEPGLVVGGRYRLESILGEGGMAVVWRAQHTETDRTVALKLVRSELSTDAEVRELFVREARIAARIGKNEHIVDVLDAGVDEALLAPFLAMELIDGEPMDARIRREGAIPAATTLELLEQAAEALDQAHGAGVFHRDLKPQNLFLAKDRRGRVRLKVLDFGIAKLAETVQQSSTHVGTPAYSAPEQLGASWRTLAAQRGKTISAEVSAATDVWALSLVAYEMLTGSRSGALWGAETLAELPLKIFLEPPPIASVRAGARAQLLPAGFDAWLARGIDLDARQRWATAGAAVAALAPLLRGGATAPLLHGAAATAPLLHAGAMPSRPPTPVGPSVPPPPLAQAHLQAHVQPHAQPHATLWAGTPAPIHDDPRIVAWSQARGMELRPGDARSFQAWQPFVYLPGVERVIREARGIVIGTQVLVGEVRTADAIRKATGEDRAIWALCTTPRARFRAAIRSKKVVGLADGMAAGLKFLDDLTGAGRLGDLLGDPQFEQRFEVKAPSREEAMYALPIPLRQVLMGMGFVGTLELRVGGLVISHAEADRFEPAMLDRLLDMVVRVAGSL
jgi:serine/threonine protein kinase